MKLYIISFILLHIELCIKLNYVLNCIQYIIVCIMYMTLEINIFFLGMKSKNNSMGELRCLRTNSDNVWIINKINHNVFSTFGHLLSISNLYEIRILIFCETMLDILFYSSLFVDIEELKLCRLIFESPQWTTLLIFIDHLWGMIILSHLFAEFYILICTKRIIILIKPTEGLLVECKWQPVSDILSYTRWCLHNSFQPSNVNYQFMKYI